MIHPETAFERQEYTIRVPHGSHLENGMIPIRDADEDRTMITDQTLHWTRQKQQIFPITSEGVSLSPMDQKKHPHHTHYLYI